MVLVKFQNVPYNIYIVYLLKRCLQASRYIILSRVCVWEEEGYGEKGRKRKTKGKGDRLKITRTRHLRQRSKREHDKEQKSLSVSFVFRKFLFGPFPSRPNSVLCITFFIVSDKDNWRRFNGRNKEKEGKSKQKGKMKEGRNAGNKGKRA